MVVMESRVCRTSVSGGSLNSVSKASIDRLLNSHNFVNKFSVLVRTSDSENLSAWIKSNLELKKSLFECNLLKLMQWIVSLTTEERKQIKAVVVNKDISHDNTVCISDGKLTLKLRSETYLKSGFSFKTSTSSKGNKKTHSQMYIHTFDLVNLESNIQNSSKNDIRLLWFAENVSDDLFKFALAINDDKRSSILQKMNSVEIQYNEDSCSPLMNNMTQCKCPNMDIVKDEDILSEQLEWISYSSILGEQTYKETDPYLSRFNSMIDVDSTVDLTVFSLDKTLLPSSTIPNLFSYLCENYRWFAITSHGVKNSTRSFNTGGEHCFVDDGTNDIIIFVNENRYALWEVTDSGDPH